MISHEAAGFEPSARSKTAVDFISIVIGRGRSIPPVSIR